MVQWFLLHHRRHRFDPCQGTKIPHAYTEQSQILFKEKNKKIQGPVWLNPWLLLTK